MNMSFFITGVACMLMIVICSGSVLAVEPEGRNASASSSETDLPSNVNVHLDLCYVDPPTASQKLDLYVPPGAGPFPVVLWIHGGAWMSGSKSAWPHMNFLVGRGFAVANVEYRFTQVAPFPAQLNDCTDALDYLSVHADKFHLDPARIAATGESAGGHLASLLGITRSQARLDAAKLQGKSHVAAVIDLFGPSDLTKLADASPILQIPVQQLLGGSLKSHRELAISASPLLQISKNDPPFLIFHGTADHTVPYSQSQQFANALVAAGVSAELISIHGAGHAGPLFWTVQQRDKMVAFLLHAMPPR